MNAILGSWEKAVAGLPACKKGSWQAMAAGSWHKDAQGEVFYEPSTCKLRRLTADAARACLANKTLAFIGELARVTLWVPGRKANKKRERAHVARV